MLRWVRWAWDCYSDHGYWRTLTLWQRRDLGTEEHAD
jgi:hypothetical protein